MAAAWKRCRQHDLKEGWRLISEVLAAVPFFHIHLTVVVASDVTDHSDEVD